jgi:hypothetical protein
LSVCGGGRGGKGEGKEGGGEGDGRGNASVRTQGCVRADASVLPLGNFITDATVRTSHRRPSGHRPSVRPSVIVCVTTLGTSSPWRINPYTCVVRRWIRKCKQNILLSLSMLIRTLVSLHQFTTFETKFGI